MLKVVLSSDNMRVLPPGTNCPQSASKTAAAGRRRQRRVHFFGLFWLRACQDLCALIGSGCRAAAPIGRGAWGQRCSLCSCVCVCGTRVGRMLHDCGLQFFCGPTRIIFESLDEPFFSLFHYSWARRKALATTSLCCSFGGFICSALSEAPLAVP